MDGYAYEQILKVQRIVNELVGYVDATSDIEKKPSAIPPALHFPTNKVYRDCGNGWGIYTNTGAIAKSEGGDKMALQYSDGAFREYRDGLLQYRFYSGGKQMATVCMRSAANPSGLMKPIRM